MRIYIRVVEANIEDVYVDLGTPRSKCIVSIIDHDVINESGDLVDIHKMQMRLGDLENKIRNGDVDEAEFMPSMQAVMD